MKSDALELTLLLKRVNSGDKAAESELYELVAPELRQFAAYLMRGERREHTLQATELVNRTYVRLARANLTLRDRTHFFAIFARAMRRELIDYARARRESAVPLDELPDLEPAVAASLDLALLVDELLDSLREVMPLACAVVELKCFLGLSDQEAADALGLPLRTLQLRWHEGRVWLFERATARGWHPGPPGPVDRRSNE